MRSRWIAGTAGGVAALCLAGAAVGFVAASESGSGPGSASPPQGVWGLLDELVRTPAHLREDRAGQMADALRSQRSAPPALRAARSVLAPRSLTIEPSAPPGVWAEPVFELADAESSAGSAVPAEDGLEGLLETYRTLSPAMKARLRGLSDAEMVRAVERLAQAERDLTGALDPK